MWASIACDALRIGVVLELRYDGYWRHGEVHAVGVTKEDNEVMRVWQVCRRKRGQRTGRLETIATG
jgi:hypothetical protein